MLQFLQCQKEPLVYKYIHIYIDDVRNAPDSDVVQGHPIRWQGGYADTDIQRATVICRVRTLYRLYLCSVFDDKPICRVPVIDIETDPMAGWLVDQMDCFGQLDDHDIFCAF